jgi:uncharacterized protein YyaL (SSP411 family)
MIPDIKKSDNKQNRLANEVSPYLLQHADNPVNWYSWSDEAFEMAKKLDRPIFLSIGYSTCHWCHVMEHESFEDHDVAALLNDAFICIKVDREERPDIDNIYMSVCRLMTGGGGWPLTIIMTPDKVPFFAGTYIPKNERFGRIGLMELVPKINSSWQNRREDILKSTDQVINALQNLSGQITKGNLDDKIHELTYKQFESSFDDEFGGFGNSPKFPTPHNYTYLLRHWRKTGEQKALDIVKKSLKKMRTGGIFDHVGFGFHRYSTDEKWLVPHFEKMLYDQALTAMAYIETYQITKDKEFANTANEIFTYVLRDMADADGAFYSAEDADSEGEEGKFYLWSEAELKAVLNDSDYIFIKRVFNVHPDGNFKDESRGAKTGENILNLTKTWLELASDFNQNENDIRLRAETLLKQLFEIREKRIHPYKDNKILTDWNGLMIASLAAGGRAINNPDYIHYAFLVWGLIELYQSTFNVEYLKSALQLNDEMIKLFWDDNNGGFYLAADDISDLIVRPKEIYDGATPSGNSVAAYNLLRLARITMNDDYEKLASCILESFANQINRAPSGFTMSLTADLFGKGPSYEIVIVGEPESNDTKAMLKAINQDFIPNKVVILRPDDKYSEIDEISEFVKSQVKLDGKATAYVCRNYSCSLPTNDIDKMLELIDVK